MQLCDNMIDKDFEESGDNTADEYESDNIGDDNAWKSVFFTPNRS